MRVVGLKKKGGLDWNLNGLMTDNKHRTCRSVLWVQLVTTHLPKRGDRLFELEGESYITCNRVLGKAYKPRISEYIIEPFLTYPIHTRFV